MSQLQHQIVTLHRLYCDLTGMDIRLDMAREHEWFIWVKRGFTEQDLRDLVAHLRREIREGRRNQGALKFRNLICNVDYFEEDLAEARAQKRARSFHSGGDKGSVLRSTGRETRINDRGTRTAAEIIRSPAQVKTEEGQRAFEAFKKLKEAL
jgi:hypothetical protein